MMIELNLLHCSGNKKFLSFIIESLMKFGKKFNHFRSENIVVMRVIQNFKFCCRFHIN